MHMVNSKILLYECSYLKKIRLPSGTCCVLGFTDILRKTDWCQTIHSQKLRWHASEMLGTKVRGFEMAASMWSAGVLDQSASGTSGVHM